MKALLVRLSAIGDVVHTLPVLAALRARGWDCGWAVEPLARPLLAAQPMLAHLEPVPGSRGFGWTLARGVAQAMKSHGYDVALDLQGLWKSAAWARMSGAPRVVGYRTAGRREALSAMLLRETVDFKPEHRHVIDKNLALLAALGIDAVSQREFPLPPSDVEAATVTARLSESGLGDDFVLLNPGGGWASKLWPAQRFGALAQGIADRGLQCLVTWGPGEEGLADRVVAASAGAARRCFPTTLLEYLELARRARLVVASDTGPLHLACAVRTPVVGIFGPTDPARNGPFSPRDITVRRTPLCSPCHKRRCSVHQGVMEAIEPYEVLAAVERRLGLGSSAVATVAV